MCSMVRKQWGFILFFSVMGVGVLRAAALQEEPVDSALHNELIIRHIAHFLTTKNDIIHFAHSAHGIHSALAHKLRKYELLHNVWKYELHPDRVIEGELKDFDAFQRKTEAYIDQQQENHGVEIRLAHCRLGLDTVSRILSFIHSAVKNHKCEIIRLDLSINLLRKIPQEVFQMKFLKALTLSFNPLNCEPGIFKRMPPIKRLWLQYVLVKQFPEGLFEGLAHLSYLCLIHNKLGSFSLNVLKPLVALERLDLAKCDIKRIESNGELVRRLPLLKVIDIDDSEELVTQLHSLKDFPFVFKRDPNTGTSLERLYK